MLLKIDTSFQDDRMRNTMDIQVKSISGEFIEIEVNGDWKIGDLKNQISDLKSETYDLYVDNELLTEERVLDCDSELEIRVNETWMHRNRLINFKDLKDMISKFDEWDGEIKESIRYVLNLESELDLYDCKSLTNTDALRGNESLIRLILYNCTSLTNIDGLKGNSSLTELDLRGCESLTNIDALQGNQSLIKLDLNYCKSLTNIDALRENRSLTELYLYGCNHSNPDEIIKTMSHKSN